MIGFVLLIAAKKNNQDSSKEVAVLEKQLNLQQGRFKVLFKEANKYNDLISKQERYKTLLEKTGTNRVKLQQEYARQEDLSQKKALSNLDQSTDERKLILKKQNLQSGIDSFTNQNSKLNGNSEAARRLSKEFTNLKKEIDSVDDDKSLENIRTKLSTLKNETRNAGLAGQSYFNELKGAFGQVFSFLSASNVIYQFSSEVGKSLGELKEMDSILTEISNSISIRWTKIVFDKEMTP